MLLSLALQNNSSSCLVLILHRQLGNYLLSSGETYGLTAQHICKTLYRSVLDTYQQVDFSLKPKTQKLQTPQYLREYPETLWYQTRVLPLPFPQVGKMSASKLIQYISNHPAAFGSQDSFPPDNITLDLANRRTDQCLSNFQSGTGVGGHMTLDMEQLM